MELAKERDVTNVFGQFGNISKARNICTYMTVEFLLIYVKGLKLFVREQLFFHVLSKFKSVVFELFNIWKD